jgi:hypothetical protein
LLVSIDPAGASGNGLPVSFLAAYVGIESVRDLLGRVEPEAAPRHRPGRPVAGGHAAAGPGQGQGGPGARLPGRAVAEANQTSLCAWLSAVLLLVGLAANAALGWWWADPAAGLGIALAAIEGVRTWRAESLADTCCD